MDAKEQTKKAYELFGSGDMETFFNDTATTEIYTEQIVGSVRCV